LNPLTPPPKKKTKLLKYGLCMMSKTPTFVRITMTTHHAAAAAADDDDEQKENYCKQQQQPPPVNQTGRHQLLI